MSADRIYLRQAARIIEESPSYVTYSKVRVVVGQDEEGTPLVYEAGDDSFRTLEIKNPWGTQAIADSILSKIRGYSYKPYTAEDAILDPVFELGDAVNVEDVYSFIASAKTEFSSLMPTTISAPDDGDLDHEYPYETSEHKEIARKINGVKTSFTVELGRITSEIEQTYETQSAAGTQYSQLRSSIEQTAQSITASVAATYETKTSATQMEQRLNSTIVQTASSITSTVSATYETKSDASAKLNTAKNYADAQDNAKAATITAAYRSEISQSADSIKATVAASESKYAVPSGVSIAVYGYGAPSNSIAPTYNGRYYLDQSSGYYYKSNGTSWVRQNSTPLKLITDNLSSSITQTANSIRSEVRASYQSKADANNDYNTLYSFIDQRADSITQSVSATYQTKSDAEDDYDTLHSLIEQRADSITLSVSSSSNGRTTFTLKDGSATLDTEYAYLKVQSVDIVGSITADEVAARSSIVSPYIYDTAEDTRLVMDETNYGLKIQTRYGNRWTDSFSIYDNGIEEVSVSAFGKLFFMMQGGSNILFSGSNVTWDFSNAKKVIMPDNTVFQ